MRSVPGGRLGRYLSDAGRGFERAPAEVAIAVALAVAFSYAVETGGESFRAWFELAAAAVLIFAAAWTGTLLHALGAVTATQRRVITVAGAIAAAAYALLFADFERAAEAWRAAMVVGAAVLWLVALPALAASWPGERHHDAEPWTATDRLRTVTGRVLLRVLGALLYCGALYLGLALALAAVNTLFELDLRGSMYAHVFGWIFLVLAPWIVLGGIDDYVRAPAPRTAVAGVVTRMAAFLVPPLLALYYVILYAYTVRIAVTGEVPKNLVSPLVFAAGALAALGLLLFDPRSRDATAFRTLRAAPPLFLPLAALGMYAVSLRVTQYGWTEFRLLRLLLLAGMAALALAATVQLVRRQRLALHAVPLFLAALLLLAAAGPWSVQAMARRSQQARLDRALHAAGVETLAVARRQQEQRTVPAEVFDDLTGAATYLHEHFGREALPSAIADVVSDRSDVYDLGSRLGLARDTPPESPDRPLAGHLPPGLTIQLGELSVTRVRSRPDRTPGTDFSVAAQDSAQVVIRVDGEPLSVAIDDLARALRSAHGAERDPRFGALPADAVTIAVHDAAGRRRGTLLILELFMTSDSTGYRLQNIDALLVR